jgi:2'-5' RNA ligase
MSDHMHEERPLLETRAQRAIFLSLRKREAWRLSRNGPVIWAPATGGPGILTSVVKVPVSLGAQVRDAVLPAADARQPHYVYPADDLHVTITNLDRYQNVPLELIEEVFTDCLNRAGPINLSLRGLSISQATIFAQVLVTPISSLRRLRMDLWRSLEPARPLPANPVSVIGFCNALRFRHEDISAVLALAERSADRDFGSFPINEIEIVRTDKVLSATNTIVLAKCAQTAL